MNSTSGQYSQGTKHYRIYRDVKHWTKDLRFDAESILEGMEKYDQLYHIEFPNVLFTLLNDMIAQANVIEDAWFTRNGQVPGNLYTLMIEANTIVHSRLYNILLYLQNPNVKANVFGSSIATRRDFDSILARIQSFYEKYGSVAGVTQKVRGEATNHELQLLHPKIITAVLNHVIGIK